MNTNFCPVLGEFAIGIVFDNLCRSDLMFSVTLYSRHSPLDIKLSCLAKCVLVLGRSSIIIYNQSFASLLLIDRLKNWQSIIIRKGDT